MRGTLPDRKELPAPSKRVGWSHPLPADALTRVWQPPQTLGVTMQLRLMFALEISEQEDTSVPEPRRPDVITTTGDSVQLVRPKPLAKCGQVVELAVWRQRRASR